MSSTSSPTFTTPRSTRPVATVPRPLIENTSSTAIKNGLSMSRTGSGIRLSSAVRSSSIDFSHFAAPLSARSPAPRVTVARSPSHLYFVRNYRPSLVDVLVADHLRQALLRLNLHDRCRQRRLAVVDVTDRPHVHVRLGP